MYGNRLRMRKFAIVGIAGITALALVAGACGGDDDDDAGGAVTPAATTAATQAAPTAVRTAAATAEPTEDGTVPGVTIGVGDGGALGEVLVGPNRLTLYTFMNDSPGGTSSSCNGSCSEAWPPLLVSGGPPAASEGASGTLATITREERATQVTYNGAPLYYFAGDEAPGDTNGEGVGGVWFVAKP